MKFFFLGTCSGTEPMPGTHHSSFVLQIEGVNYWFEAGENAVHRAVEVGLDVMKTVALFVSHPHIDHIGGMANLLSCFSKRHRHYNETLIRNDTVEVFFPHEEILAAIKTVASQGLNRFRYNLADHPITDGVLFEDENLRVTALHNTHMKEDGSNGWHAYSFLLEAESKKIVFSGDVGKPEELSPLIGDGCDMLIMETGHHKVEDVLAFAVDKKVKNLRFTHHGRQILERREEMEQLCAITSSQNPICVRILRDGDTELF